MSIEFRTIEEADQPKAIRLWDETFKPGAGYFDRYFAVDPWYQPGDSFGAWEGDRLVSAVHLCRRPVEWAGRTLWCAAVANVATEPAYRRRGLSRHLLRQALERMHTEGLEFSMLFTGVFGHYAALGWEQVETPRLQMKVAESLPLAELDGNLEHEFGALGGLYSQVPPRPLRLHRPEGYFRGWVGWEWAGSGAAVLGHPKVGFAAVSLAGETMAQVLEWHALDAAGERELLLAAAHHAWLAGRPVLRLAGLPFYGGPALVSNLGMPEVEQAGPMMLRNLHLPPEEYAELKRLYTSGDAVWWPSDGF